MLIMLKNNVKYVNNELTLSFVLLIIYVYIYMHAHIYIYIYIYIFNVIGFNVTLCNDFIRFQRKHENPFTPLISHHYLIINFMLAKVDIKDMLNIRLTILFGYSCCIFSPFSYKAC